MKKKKYTLLGYMLEKKQMFLLFLVFTILLAVVAPLKSYIMQWLIDAPDKEAAMLFLGKGIGIVLLSHILEWFSRMSFTKIACKNCEQVRNQIILKQTEKSMKTCLSENSGDILSCLTNDMRVIYDEYYMSIFNILMWGSMMLVALGMIASISPVLFVVSLILGSAPLIVPKIMARKMGKLREQYSRIIAEYTAKVSELLKGFEVLLVSGALPYFTENHKKEASAVQEGEYRTQRMLNISMVVSSLISWIPNIMTLLFGVLLVYDGKLTMGYLVTAHTLSNFVISPGRMVSDAYAKLKASRRIKEKLEDIMNREEETVEDREIDCADSISIQHLTFTYPQAQVPALKDINMVFHKNEKTALVGGSGSGKSTIAKILCKYFDSYSGNVQVDGCEVRRIKRDHYYQRVMMIPQTPYLFSDSIYNNICLYQKYDTKEVEKAICLAGLSEFMQKQPEGWNTVLAEGGRNLSGGQAQRIAIARAILRHCDFLIVDEATSSLDVKTTHEIMENLLDIDCSMIIITHDILGSYMEKFDTVCYLEQGELKEKGTFKELIERNAGFSAMYYHSA